MQTSLQTGQQVTVIGKPVTGTVPPQPSRATLSNQVYTSSDPTIFTVAADPATPGGAIIQAIAKLNPGDPSVSATLTETATATEPDGTTTEVIQGVATVIVTSAPPPPPPPAASIVFEFGTPTPIPPTHA